MEESPPYMVAIAKKSHSENQALANRKSQNRIRLRGPWEGDKYNLGAGQAPKNIQIHHYTFLTDKSQLFWESVSQS